MPRRNFAQEAFHMDHLRSSPSQQHLDPASASSTSSQQDHNDLDRDMQAGSNGLIMASGGGPDLGASGGGGQRPHKLDLYSIPVFLLECILLGALSFAAYFVHYQYKLVPLISGFYCDDISLRQSFFESTFTQQFRQPDNEMTVLALLLVVPLVVVVFCELVNSMFGALKFRQIRSLCKCCKLHSITRRTLRFSGAYLLGFFIVVISCDILATSAGKFRPYFAQDCPLIYNECIRSPSELPAGISGNAQPIMAREESLLEQFGQAPATSSPANFNKVAAGDVAQPVVTSSTSLISTVDNDQPISRPLSPPIASDSALNILKTINGTGLSRTRRDATAVTATTKPIDKSILERKWIDLTDANLKELCQFSGDSKQEKKFDSIARSWPSFPGAVFTYACLYLACYLSFVGTARPIRLITSVLVMTLVLASIIFNVQLVKEHYNHWEDVAGAIILSIIVVLFILLVYLNKFRDSHYYENQKLYGSASKRQQQLQRSFMMSEMLNPYNKFGYSNAAGQYNLEKFNSSHVMGGGGGATGLSVQNMQNGIEPTTASSNNDLAMRYFQIPRANYRGAPRPLSSVNRN